jgi:hypothetical protein
VDLLPAVAAPPLVVRQRDGDYQFPLDFRRHYGICERRGIQVKAPDGAS